MHNRINQILLIKGLPLRYENPVRAVGHLTPQGDIACISSHNLNDAAALMGSGCVLNFIDGADCRIHRRIKTDGVIRAVNVQVDGSRDTDRIDSKG